MDTYSARDAAKLLQESESGIRRKASEGEIPAHQDEKGRWRVSQEYVNEHRKEQRQTSASERDTSGEVLRLQEEVRELREALGYERGRIELTSWTESTMREQADRERERADRLEAKLEREREERSKGLWAKLIGR